jgi:hypothetical protein
MHSGLILEQKPFCINACALINCDSIEASLGTLTKWLSYTGGAHMENGIHVMMQIELLWKIIFKLGGSWHRFTGGSIMQVIHNVTTDIGT